MTSRSFPWQFGGERSQQSAAMFHHHQFAGGVKHQPGWNILPFAPNGAERISMTPGRQQGPGGQGSREQRREQGRQNRGDQPGGQQGKQTGQKSGQQGGNLENLGQYLQGCEWPCKPDEIERVAKQNDAPDKVLEQIRAMPDRQFDDRREFEQNLQQTTATR